MTARLVPDQLTKLSVDGIVGAVIGGYRLLMGDAPKPRTAAIAAAQACLEGGNGEHIHCNNPGNKKKPTDWDGDYCTFKCDELFDGPTTEHAKRLAPELVVVNPWHPGPDGKARFRVVLLPGHPWAMFVAFPTVEQGFADWLELIALTDRYRQAWKCAFAGDPHGFVRGLAAGHYMTADVDVYERAVVSITDRIEPACERHLALGDLGITDDDRAHVQALVTETISSNLIWMPDRHDQVAA